MVPCRCRKARLSLRRRRYGNLGEKWRNYAVGMKATISIPDPIFRKADAIARSLRKSRSQLYAEAMSEYLLRHESDAITQAMNAVCDTLDTTPAPDLSAAAARVLKRTEW